MTQDYLTTDTIEDISNKVFLATKPEIPIYTNAIDEIRAEFERNESKHKKQNLFLMKKRRRTYDRYHKAH
jgi:hypothetical protein